jgi:TolB-like protein/cytochrome c-type biogenesis protein CcmH/NrfG
MSENNGFQGPQGEASPAEAMLRADAVRDVFVSYASQDAELANAVVLAVEKNGLTCWIAPRDVIPGDLYADGIIRAITGSKVFVLVLSRSAIASNHVGKEVERASSKRRPIVALRTDATPLTPALEYFLSESQWIELHAGQTDAALNKVVDAVRRQRGVEAIKASAYAEPTSSANPKRHWLGGLALIALLVAVAAYFIVDRFRAAGHESQSLSVTTSVPAVHMPGLSAPVISEKSVAVLPFVDMSEKKDQEYFSDGMSEELINLLTSISDLQVPSRTSAFYFKGKPATVAEIARTLGVAYVLEGSVRQSGKTLRVTAQLIRADNGYHVWSRSFDRPIGDVFKIQDEVAAAVVKALKVSLSAGATPKEVGTNNVEAYNLYLQARSIDLHANTAEDYENVVKYLRQALTLDDSFARAWATLSGAYKTQAQLGFADGHFAWEAARDAAKRAIVADPNLAYGHLSLALILIYGELNLRDGYFEMRQALALDPRDGLALSMAALEAASQGQFEKAIALARKGVESDPVHPWRYLDLSRVLYLATKYEDALVAIRKQSDLDPTFHALHLEIAEVLLAQGNPQAALAEADREPDAKLREQCGCRVLAYQALGRTQESDAALAIMEKKHADEDAYDIGRIYASRGDPDKAFEWFDQAYQQRESDLIWVKVDPLLKNVQSDPRFLLLLKKIGLSD